MEYRKFTADHLFTGSRLLENQVLVTDEKGFIEAVIPTSEAGSEVQTLAGILVPGFVNAHCHLELSHLKGVLEPRKGMIDFLLGVMSQRFVPEENILQAIADAETAMWQNGIVAVGDICNTPHTLPQKALRRLYYHNFIETTGFVPATAPARFQTSRELWERFQQAGGPAAKNNTIVPHAPYSVSPALFELITSWEANTLLTLHNQESKDEEAFFRTGKGDFNRLYEALGLDISFYKPEGKSSLQTCLPRFHNGQSLILVHNVLTSEDDLRFINKSVALPDCHFCLCPNANLYIGNGLPDLDMLRSHGVSIVIGTDSLASNEQLSVLAEIKTLQSHYPGVPLEELLQWATLNGAKALGIQHVFGSFEKGKTPGVVLLHPDLSGIQRFF
ncbi:amidohydrolase family protein [Paraflavitalea speifideaquila]|uniref:amidohydrolase family protein n=1 Tax=Paraflavitalea speifideaquila TaxID=3076558 RepID=UPI0028E23711|nr:amidohydrolase family protein [Paraflavitalea speifideiaquila]